MSCTISGTFLAPDGSTVSLGTLILTLSQNAVETGTGWVVPQRITIALNSSGAIPAATTIIGNDSLTPLGTTYSAEIKTAGDAYYSIGNFSITGSTFNFNTATPTGGGVTYPFPVLQNPTSPQTITGQPLTLTPTAPLYVADLQGVIIFADQMSGADSSAKIQAAINLLPATGGIVDARALPNETSGGSVPIDPGTKPVTILLPPVTTFISTITIQNNIQIIGCGSGSSFLQTSSTTVTPIVSTTTTTIQHATLQDFQLVAPTGSAYNQHGIWIQITNPNNQGMWYSFFKNVIVIGFGGVQLFLDGTGGGNNANPTLGDNQFNTYINVQLFRKTVSAWVSGTSYTVGQTVNINGGKVTAYASGTAYTPGQMVFNAGSTYMCIADSTGHTPPNVSFWQIINGVTTNAYSGGTAYVPGNLVISSGITYVCIANSTGNTPASNPAFWTALSQYATAATYRCVQNTSSANPLNVSFWAPYDAYALYLLGANGQNVFINCQTDGQFGGNNAGINCRVSATSNIGANFALPYSNKFIKHTCQFAALGWYITGCVTHHLDSPHFESCYGGVLVDYDPIIGAGCTGLKVNDGHWLTSSGVNGGAGYLVSMAPNTTNPGTFGNEFGDMTFTGNNVFGFAGVPSASIPDNVILASGGSNSVISNSNSSAASTNTIGTSTFIPTFVSTASLVTGRAKSANVTTSGTAITNFNSLLAPGETFTLNCTSGPVQIIGGTGISQSLTMQTGDSAIFVVLDGTSGMAMVGSNKPAVVSSVTLLNQSAGVSATNMYTVPSGQSGLYRITVSLVVTVGSGAATASGGVSYTNDGGSSIFNPLTATANLSTLAFEATGAITVDCVAGSNINYITTTAGTVGAARFAARFRIEYLG